MRKSTQKTIVIPPVAGSGYEANMVINFVDRATGWNMDAATGEISSSVSWSSGAFVETSGSLTVGKWKKDSNSGKVVVSLPEIETGKMLYMFITNSSSPSKDDIPTRQALFDPDSGLWYGDLVPVVNGRVR